MSATKLTEPVSLNIEPDDPSNYTLAILGDLHMDPRDVEHSYEGREHVKKILDVPKDQPIYIYGGQTKNFYQMQKSFLRKKIRKDKNKHFFLNRSE